MQWLKNQLYSRFLIFSAPLGHSLHTLKLTASVFAINHKRSNVKPSSSDSVPKVLFFWAEKLVQSSPLVFPKAIVYEDVHQTRDELERVLMIDAVLKTRSCCCCPSISALLQERRRVHRVPGVSGAVGAVEAVLGDVHGPGSGGRVGQGARYGDKKRLLLDVALLVASSISD